MPSLADHFEKQRTRISANATVGGARRLASLQVQRNADRSNIDFTHRSAFPGSRWLFLGSGKSSWLCTIRSFHRGLVREADRIGRHRQQNGTDPDAPDDDRPREEFGLTRRVQRARAHAIVPHARTGAEYVPSLVAEPKAYRSHSIKDVDMRQRRTTASGPSADLDSGPYYNCSYYAVLELRVATAMYYRLLDVAVTVLRACSRICLRVSSNSQRGCQPRTSRARVASPTKRGVSTARSRELSCSMAISVPLI